MDQLECLPYSVGNAQEGVCLLIRMGPYRVLLDCGLSDPAWMADRELLQSVDLVLCSHAHPDHARGLLALNRAFPQLPICASEVTAQLLPLNWLNEEVPLFSRLSYTLLDTFLVLPPYFSATKRLTAPIACSIPGIFCSLTPG
jgi:Cft2 family RNA processing exonuclease